MAGPLQSQMQKDLAVFMNSNEFGEQHSINGTDGVTCILENEDGGSLRSQLGRFDGTFKATVLLLIRESDWQWGQPTYNQVVTVDKIPYNLRRFNLVAGMYEMTLEAVR